MELVIKSDANEVCLLAAKIIASLIRQKPDAVLGLASGNTPLPIYKELIRLNQKEGLDFSRVTTFNLDEYIGLGPDHPCSYHRFMMDHLFQHINVPEKQIHVPDGLSEDIPRFCQDYEAEILRNGGIDLQLLGIGEDGHIGFNEPTSSLSSRTRIKTLTQRTLDANQRFFDPGEAIPHHVITMGVGTILEARRCLLVAHGKNKASAVAKMVEGPITSMVPASVLQLHTSATAIIDEAASKDLSHTDYYRYVYDNKPEWQQYE